LTRAARTSRILRVKVRNEVIREDMEVTQSVLERMEYNVLKWYGHVSYYAWKITDGLSE
jgi:hypothetical protein